MRLPLTLQPKPSRWLQWVVGIGHAAAGIALLGSAMLSWSLVLFGLVISLSAILSVYRLGNDVPESLTLRSDGSLEIVERDGIRAITSIDKDSVALPWLILVRLEKREGKSPYLIMTRDSLDSDGIRSICLWMRWRAKDPTEQISKPV
jgi:hypothetical protein